MAGNKKPKKKYVKRDINFKPIRILNKLTEEEHEKLIQPPKDSLKLMEDGKSTPTDWWNVTFRILCTLRISHEVYAAVTVDALEEGYQTCIRIRRRCLDEKAVLWVPTPDEYVELFYCVDAANEVQRDVDRVTQLNAYQKAYAEMKQYLVRD